jgi:hypothetical protein
MEYVEDYDEQCKILVKKIDKMFKSCKDAAEAEKPGLLISIKRAIKEMREVCTLFKSDLYLVPRTKEAEYKQKYDEYILRLGKYDHNAKKLDLIIKKDTDGLEELKNGYDEEKIKEMKGLNGATQALAK